jgi:adenylate cyclase class 2
METTTETEVKIRVSEGSLSSIRRKLREFGFQQKAERAKEENLLFDFSSGKLAESGSALRLRRYGSKKLLTFKGPRIEDPRLKIREEIETGIDDFVLMRRILESLGMSTCFEYGKYREKFLFSGGTSDVEVCIDETPVGCFVEIEGSASSIEEVAHAMGWTPDQFINRNYVDLYQEESTRENRCPVESEE